MSFALSQDCMWVYQALPVDAGHCSVLQTICFPAASLELADFETRAAHYYRRIDAALDEDLPFLERQQRGLDSPFARPGRFGALEPSVGRFAYWYAQRLSEQLDAERERRARVRDG
jgi:phenylpropionate dioxygenase-like ring-hydroxylating dioxygenase large terminal subunit